MFPLDDLALHELLATLEMGGLSAAQTAVVGGRGERGGGDRGNAAPETRNSSSSSLCLPFGFRVVRSPHAHWPQMVAYKAAIDKWYRLGGALPARRGDADRSIPQNGRSSHGGVAAEKRDGEGEGEEPKSRSTKDNSELEDDEEAAAEPRRLDGFMRSLLGCDAYAAAVLTHRSQNPPRGALLFGPPDMLALDAVRHVVVTSAWENVGVARRRRVGDTATTAATPLGEDPLVNRSNTNTAVDGDGREEGEQRRRRIFYLSRADVMEQFIISSRLTTRTDQRKHLWRLSRANKRQQCREGQRGIPPLHDSPRMAKTAAELLLVSNDEKHDNDSSTDGDITARSCNSTACGGAGTTLSPLTPEPCGDDGTPTTTLPFPNAGEAGRKVGGGGGGEEEEKGDEENARGTALAAYMSTPQLPATGATSGTSASKRPQRLTDPPSSVGPGLAAPWLPLATPGASGRGTRVGSTTCYSLVVTPSSRARGDVDAGGEGTSLTAEALAREVRGLPGRELDELFVDIVIMTSSQPLLRMVRPDVPKSHHFNDHSSRGAGGGGATVAPVTEEEELMRRRPSPPPWVESQVASLGRGKVPSTLGITSCRLDA